MPRVGIDLVGVELDAMKIAQGIMEIGEDILFFTDQPMEYPHILCKEVVTHADRPRVALRKEASSIMQGLAYLKEREIDAFISAGNTGALVAGARKTLSNPLRCRRPALLTDIPTQHGVVHLLDAGANLYPDPLSLLYYACIGASYHRCLGGETPKIGYLNIGVEESKGTEFMRKTYSLLKKHVGSFAAEFIGNIEPRDLFFSDIHVVVTDAICGNIFLKTCEGIAGYLARMVASPKVADQLNYQRYPGALLCGFEPIIMKCHGRSSVETFITSIQRSLVLLRNGWSRQMVHGLSVFSALSVFSSGCC